MKENSIVRKLTIDRMMDVYNPIYQYLDSYWNRLTKDSVDIYHTNGNEYIYYYTHDNTKEWILYADLNKNTIRVNCYQLYLLLDMVNIPMQGNTLSIIQYFFLEEKLKLNIDYDISDYVTIYNNSSFYIEDKLNPNNKSFYKPPARNHEWNVIIVISGRLFNK